MTVPANPWDRLYADVKIALPGVTDAVYAQELFRTFKDFCDQTNIWQETVPITGLPNVTSYPFTVAGKGAPNRLMIMYDPNLSNGPLDRRWVQHGVAMPVPGTIVVNYAPSEQVAWEAIVAKTPIDPLNTDHQPDVEPEDWWIVDDCRDALYYGVLARLQIQPLKPYSNPQLSKYNMGNYITQRGMARTMVIKKHTYGAQAWSFPQGWATTARKGWV